MRGLVDGSRAQQSLRSKLPSSRSSSGDVSIKAPSSSCRADEDNASLEDAIDLVSRCLEVDSANRPTADLVCDHRFLAGRDGWRGHRGWELDLEDPDSSGGA